MKRILVVDDRAELRDFMQVALARAGYDVVLARNGAEALAVQRERSAELVITDIFMPEVDGIELIDRLRAAYPGTRVIAISAGVPGLQDYLKVARQIGCDATLAKPFGAEALLRVVGSVLG